MAKKRLKKILPLIAAGVGAATSMVAGAVSFGARAADNLCCTM